MAIIEDSQLATREDIAQAQTLAQAKLHELEAAQADHLQRHRWSDARAISLNIAAQRAWLEDLQRFGATLNATKVTAPALEEWLGLLRVLTGEFDAAHSAVIARRTVERFDHADQAWRSLNAFRSDAYGATADKAFHPQGTPAAPSQRAELQSLSLRHRNPMARRPYVNKSRWQHLL